MFSCVETTQDDEDGVGSFRHYVGKNARLKQPGTYEIHAKVCLLKIVRSTFSLPQIAGYHPGRNIKSEHFADHDIDILGDIDSVRNATQLTLNRLKISLYRCSPSRKMTTN